jgi:hypothetical protein
MVNLQCPTLAFTARGSASLSRSQGPADTARHVKACHSTQETKVRMQHMFDDVAVAGNIGFNTY